MKKTFSRLSVGALLLGGLFLTAGTLTSCGGTSSTTTQATSVDTTLTVSSTTTSIIIKGTTTLTVQAGGRNVSGVTYATSDAAIATVDGDGKVTGVAVGTVTITASAAGYTSGTITITVRSNVQNVTFSITPTFHSDSRVKAVESGYAIFFSSTIDNWGNGRATKATLDETTGKWEVTFENVEFGQTISYNTYYSREDGDGWDYVNTESVDHSSRSLEIEEGTLSYSISSTFNIPDTLSSLEFKITATLNGNALSGDYYVFFTSATSDWSVENRATNNESEGYWEYTDRNIPLGYYEYQILLGSSIRGYWDTQVQKSIEEVTSDMDVVEISVDFTTAPDISGKVDYAFYLTLDEDISNSNDVNVVIDDGTEKWVKMTKIDSKHFAGYYLFATAGTYTFYFYNWVATEDIDTIYLNTTPTKFSITVTENGSVSVNGSFTTGTGTIATPSTGE